MDKTPLDERNKEIQKIFNRFAGKIVDPANPQDFVLKEMKFEASSHYSTLNLVPKGAQSENRNICRINAELIDAGGGKWKIGKRFFCG